MSKQNETSRRRMPREGIDCSLETLDSRDNEMTSIKQSEKVTMNLEFYYH